MAREIFATEELVVREAQDLTAGQGGSGTRPGYTPHLVLTPQVGVLARMDRPNVEALYEALGEWLGARA